MCQCKTVFKIGQYLMNIWRTVCSLLLWATLYTSFPVPTCQLCFQKRSYCLIIAHKQFNDPCRYTLSIHDVSCAITLPHLRRVVSSCSRLPIVTIGLSVMISKQYLFKFLSTHFWGKGCQCCWRCSQCSQFSAYCYTGPLAIPASVQWSNKKLSCR